MFFNKKVASRKLTPLDQAHAQFAGQLIRTLVGKQPDKTLELVKPIDFGCNGQVKTARIWGQYDFRSEYRFSRCLPAGLHHLDAYRMTYALEIVKDDDVWQPVKEFESWAEIRLRQKDSVDQHPVSYLVAWQDGYVKAHDVRQILNGCSFWAAAN